MIWISWMVIPEMKRADHKRSDLFIYSSDPDKKKNIIKKRYEEVLRLKTQYSSQR